MLVCYSVVCICHSTSISVSVSLISMLRNPRKSGFTVSTEAEKVFWFSDSCCIFRFAEELITCHIVMDWDLWGPSYTQDSPESSFDIRQHEWECDFYFGYGADVIEEDALNEKSCVEALRKLISKANIEIEELEENLVILQTQSEWAEQNKLKEWFDICCKGLEEKTNFLELLIRNLKNEIGQNDCDNDFQSLMHVDPPRRISEMVKDLLRTRCQSKSEQPEDIAMKDTFRDGTGESSDRESLSNFDSGSSITDEILEPSVTHADISLDSTIIVKDFRSDAFSHETGKSDDEKSLSSLSLKIITTEEVKESNVSCINISLNSSMKPDEKSMNHPVTVAAREVGIFYTDNAIAESPSDLLGHVAKDISMSDTMAVQEPKIPATDSTVNENSHLKLQGQTTKNEMQLHPVDGHEPCVTSIADVISNTSSNSRGRDRQKPGSTCMNANANNQKRTMKTVQPISCGVQESGVESNDNETSLLPPSKPLVKRRKITKPSDIAKVEEPSESPTEFATLQGVKIESTSKEDLQNSCGAQDPGFVDDNSHGDLFPPSKPQVTQKKSTKPSDVAKVNENSETLQGDTVKSTSKEDLQLPNSCMAQEPSVVDGNSYDSLCPSSKPQAKRSKSKIQLPSVALENSTLQGDTIEMKSGKGLEFCKSSVGQESSVASDHNHSELLLQSKPSGKKRKRVEKDLQLPKSGGISESHDKVTGLLPKDPNEMMKLKLCELRAFAKERGLKGFSGKKKGDIVTLLLQKEEETATLLPQGKFDHGSKKEEGSIPCASYPHYLQCKPVYLRKDRRNLQGASLNRKILVERDVLVEELLAYKVGARFGRLNWTDMLIQPDFYYPTLVREFYANLVMVQEDDDGSRFTSYVKGVVISFNAVELGVLLSVSSEGERVYYAPGSHLDKCLPPDGQRKLFKVLSNDRFEENEDLFKFPPSQRVLIFIAKTNLAPSKGHNTLPPLMPMVLAHSLYTGQPICLPHMVMQYMARAVMNSARNNTLPYGRLLTRVFLFLGIDLDHEPKGTCTEGPIGFNALQKMNLYYDYDSVGEQVQYGDGRGAREEDEDDSDDDLEFMGSGPSATGTSSAPGGGSDILMAIRRLNLRMADGFNDVKKQFSDQAQRLEGIERGVADLMPS
ncbi:uncharacterized protein LOC122643453 [Telopea speciosissima]|uniref:uncharacterized protein LOC122643453 n=1 Tax=Telopea speciosissima TaxID=54955 RepID=UPI001CC61C6D|nr:uncharacterized protein LOC122643453 [Telopea speciosissima]